MRYSLLLASALTLLSLTGCVHEGRGGYYGPHGEYRGREYRDRDRDDDHYRQYQYYPDGTYYQYQDPDQYPEYQR